MQRHEVLDAHDDSLPDSGSIDGEERVRTFRGGAPSADANRGNERRNESSLRAYVYNGEKTGSESGIKSRAANGANEWSC